VEIGKARVFREGTDLSIITYGSMVWVAQEAAETLEREGVSAEIIDLRTVLPIDEETVLSSVRKTSRAILLHEDTLTGGVGAELAARIAERAFDSLDAPIVRIAAPDTPVPFSTPLEEAFLPNAGKVLEKARWLVRLLITPGGAAGGSGPGAAVRFLFDLFTLSATRRRGSSRCFGRKFRRVHRKPGSNCTPRK